ncbi:spore-associated protein A [Streptomyces roseoverticillatus]|uniref:spore-associated protein A n=1 Tax=Streptomyces roseoverticillatus TaxID=66429 RepID=UPI001F3B0267|nr:spore-associated protein A [Streptomyces roseoverticillatus]MCF3105963.1 spore-associated protein A [Streptomyces roseoverticillatus]
MKRAVRTRVAGAALLAAATTATTLAVGAGTAVAAPAPAAAYNRECGSGYTQVNQIPIPGRGTVFLAYNAATGKNCVVTKRNTSTGLRLWVGSWLQRNQELKSKQEQYGFYTSYSGPVHLDAKSKCVDWGGEIDGYVVARYKTNCGTLA